MLYGVEVTRTAPDRYGFPSRITSTVLMDAKNKQQARALVREQCVMREWRCCQIGKAALKVEG